VLENAAGADTGRILGTDEFDGDLGLDRLAQVDAEEVDMLGVTGDRMTNEFLEDDGLTGSAVDLEIEDCAAMGERAAKLAGVD